MVRSDRIERARRDLSLLLVTDRRRVSGPLAGAVREALSGGVSAVMLREKDLETPDLVSLGEDVARACREAGAAFVVNHDESAARELDADGVHLGFRSPRPASVRATLGARVLVGVSTHDKDELKRAIEEGADYVTFGPVYDTPSKRGLLEPRGLEALREAVEAAGDVAVLALGGINADRVGQVRATGVAGVAFIGAVLDAEDPAAAARGLASAWEADA